MKSSGLTVGQLRAALADLPDDMEIVVRASGKHIGEVCGGIWHVGPDTGCDDGGEFIALEVSDDEADFEPPPECETCLGRGRLGFEDGHRKCLNCNGSGVAPC